MIKLSLEKLFDWEKYSKIFCFRLVIWYPNQVKTGQPICFTYKNIPFLKSINVKYCWILSNNGHFFSFWVIFELFYVFLHYSTLANKKKQLFVLNRLFQSNPNDLFVLICWYSTLFDFYGKSCWIIRFIHLVLICLMIQITSFWLLSICFRIQTL